MGWHRLGEHQGSFPFCGVIGPALSRRFPSTGERLLGTYDEYNGTLCLAAPITFGSHVFQARESHSRVEEQMKTLSFFRSLSPFTALTAHTVIPRVRWLRAPSGRYHPWGFRPTGLVPVEAHTTFSLKLLTQDLYLFTEGLDLVANAENWELSCADTPIGVVPPSRAGVVDPVAQAASAGGELSAGAGTSPPPATPTAKITLPEHRTQQDRDGGAEAAGGMQPPWSTLAERDGGARALGGGLEKQKPSATRPPSLTESEAWERVAREVRSTSSPYLFLDAYLHDQHPRLSWW